MFISSLEKLREFGSDKIIIFCAFYSFYLVSGVFQSIHKLVENGPLRFQTCLFQKRSESQLVIMSRSEKNKFY